MGQRINIQYSVDIDDLDTEVRRLMADAHKRYSSLEDIYDNGRDTVLSNEARERVDRIRLELAAIDHRLNDVVNIIAGYLHYKAQANQPPPAAQPPAPRPRLPPRRTGRPGSG